jgi:transcriptional regulator with XRE-family HTH domain
MLLPTLKLYPSWNVQKAPIPPRSRLYYLEPIGVGTPYVESLTGYIARLAQQHCITTRRLILNEIAPCLGEIFCHPDSKRKVSRFGTDFWDYQNDNISHVLGTEMHRAALNGTGLMASNLVCALTALTRNTNLHFLTLLSWGKVFPNRGLLHHQRAWCPKCYQEWHDNDKSIYEPLLWSINVVVICPIHHNCLLCVCPHCHQSMPIISGNSRTGHCSQCGHWLGSLEGTKISTSNVESKAGINEPLALINNLGELIAATPSITSPPLKNRISNVISTYINQVFATNIAAASRKLGIEKTTLSLWCKGKAIPRLDKLLLLTQYLEISLLDFLTKDSLTTEFQNNLFPQEPTQVKCLRKSHKKMDLERKEVLNIVLQEITNEYPPPSLENVALRLRYRPLVLQYHFSELCQTIKVRHADYKKVSKQQKIEPILEAVLQEYPPPSLLEITRRLGYKNNSYLYRYFPELSRSISKRYQEHSIASGQQKRERIRQEIFDVAQLLHSQGYKPTQSRVTKLLKKPGVILTSYARSYLREVQQSLGYE